MKRLIPIVIITVLGAIALAQPTPVPGLQRCAHDNSLTGDCRVATPIGARVKTGGGLTTSGGTTGLSLLATCANGQMERWDAGSSAWVCGSIVDDGVNLGIGLAAPTHQLSIDSTATCSGDVPDSACLPVAITEYERAAPSITLRRTLGQQGSPSALTALGDKIGQLRFQAYTTTGFQHIPQVGIEVANAESGSPTASSQGTYMQLRTTPIGSASSQGALKIDSTGYVGIGPGLDTATVPARLSVISGDPGTGRGTSATAWDGSWAVFGSAANSNTGAGLGIAYSSTDDASVIASAKPGTALKPLHVYATETDISGTAYADSGQRIIDTTASSARIAQTGNSIDLATVGSAGSCTNCSLTFDVWGRETARASGATPLTAITVTAPITSTGGSSPTIGINYGTQSQVVCWGDSLTRGAFSSTGTGYPTVLAALTGWATFNEGGDGQTSTTIASRMIANTEKHGRPAIIWAGRNNYAAEATVESDIASMYAALGSQSYIVLSVINSAASTEWSGGVNYNHIIAINTSLAATYGSHYLDVRAYLVSLYNPAIPQDVIDHGHDTIPSSLQYSDGLHLNDAGYAAVAAFIAAHISLLQADAVKAVVETDVAKPTTTLQTLAMVGQLNAIGGTVAMPGITIGSTFNTSGLAATGLYNPGDGIRISNEGYDIIATSITGTVFSGNMLVSAGGLVTFDAAHPSYWNYSTNKDTYLRAGETAGMVTIGDPNTGGVFIGAASNPTSVLGTLSVGAAANMNSNKITSLANGSSAQDAVAFNQLATAVNASVAGTTNTIAMFTSPNAVGNSNITKSGNQITIAGTTYGPVINYSTGEDLYLRGGKVASAVYIGDANTGGVVLGAAGNSSSVLGALGVTGAATLSSTLNVTGVTTLRAGTVGAPGLVVGSHGGIYDNGSGVSIENSGFDVINTSITGTTLSGATNVNGSLLVNTTTELTGIVKTDSMITDNGTKPTLSSCGTSSVTSSAGAYSFDIAVTAGSVPTCTATFAVACPHTPTCFVESYDETKNNIYVSAHSTTAVTVAATSSPGSNLNGNAFGILCICH